MLTYACRLCHFSLVFAVRHLPRTPCLLLKCVLQSGKTSSAMQVSTHPELTCHSVTHLTTLLQKHKLSTKSDWFLSQGEKKLFEEHLFWEAFRANVQWPQRIQITQHLCDVWGKWKWQLFLYNNCFFFLMKWSPVQLQQNMEDFCHEVE